jgi:hypothetical protein
LAYEGLVVLPPVVVASGIITVETVGPPVLIACLTNPSSQKLIGVGGVAMLGKYPDYIEMGESLGVDYLPTIQNFSWEESDVPYMVQNYADNYAYILSNPASFATDTFAREIAYNTSILNYHVVFDFFLFPKH